MLHKERGVISTCSDPRGRPTVLSYFAGAKERLYPVGRLDADTEGLLLITNDGALAHRLTHPRFEVEKAYVAYLRGQITARQAHMLERGVELDGVRTSPAQVTVKASEAGKSTARIVLTEGRNRQVRRMFETVGLPVERLVRVQVGSLPLGALRPGKYRKLMPHEVQRLLDEAAAGEMNGLK
jgi:23S rRNA pseudouridine2605 synthase